MDKALSRWNGYVKSLTLPVANAMSWEDLKILMLVEYCPRGEVQKLEQELWNLTMKDSNIVAYTAKFSDLVVLCPGMVTPESIKVEQYIWGLSPQIQGNMISANPSTFDSAKRLAQTLVDHGVCQGFMTAIPEQTKGSDNKRKFWNKKKGQSTQEPTKKQQTMAVHADTVLVAPAPGKQYVELSQNATSATFITMEPVASCTVLIATRRGTSHFSVRHRHNKPPKPLTLG